MMPSDIISLCLDYLNSYSRCFMARQSHSASSVCRSLFFFQPPAVPPPYPQFGIPVLPAPCIMHTIYPLMKITIKGQVLGKISIVQCMRGVAAGHCVTILPWSPLSSLFPSALAPSSFPSAPTIHPTYKQWLIGMGVGAVSFIIVRDMTIHTWSTLQARARSRGRQVLAF